MAIIGTDNGQVIFLDLESKKVTNVFKEHEGVISSIEIVFVSTKFASENAGTGS